MRCHYTKSLCLNYRWIIRGKPINHHCIGRENDNYVFTNHVNFIVKQIVTIIYNLFILLVQMILSFELPFALIPLLKFSSSNPKMGPHKNSIYVSCIFKVFFFFFIIFYISSSDFLQLKSCRNVSSCGHL